jgi:hypothetical protein
LAPEQTLGGDVTYAALERTSVSVPEPCRCETSALLPVAAIVAAHSTDNDNALIGLDAQALSQAERPERVDLPCGEYYFAGIDGERPLTIAAHGKTAIYIEGNVVSPDFLAFTLDETSELDIFISGTLTAGNHLILGSRYHPALTRVYVGGSGAMRFGGDARLSAQLYAPRAELQWASGRHAFGSIFAGTFAATAATRIHYDQQVAATGDQSCGP